MKTLQEVAQSIDNAIRSILEDAGMKKDAMLSVSVFGVDYARMTDAQYIHYSDGIGDGFYVERQHAGPRTASFFADEKTCPEYVPEITAPEGEEKPF